MQMNLKVTENLCPHRRSTEVKQEGRNFSFGSKEVAKDTLKSGAPLYICKISGQIISKDSLTFDLIKTRF